MGRRFDFVGARVIGPSHRAAGTPCQDALGGEGRRFGGWAAVADGVGSCSLSHVGSAAAVAACRWAWLHWSRKRDADAASFTRLVEAHWRLELGDVPPNDACTTLLFAGVTASGRVLVAQVGDGLLCMREHGRVVRLTPPRTGFGNQTDALGDWRAPWFVDVFAAAAPDLGFLLMTDGVSDDLVPDHDGAFFDWCVQDFLRAPDGAAKLSAALDAWPVPHHSDDKTMAVLCTR